MSYTRERDQLIARLTTEGLSLDAITVLLRCATAMQRYAELACSSQDADRDRVPCPAGAPKWGGPCLCDEWHEDGDTHGDVPRIAIRNYNAEMRARAALVDGWRLVTQGDPRGYVLRVIPPSYAARNEGRDRHNLDTIAVPARPSRLRF